MSLPAGQSTIRVAKSANDGASINIKSLELLRESDRAAFEQRVQSFRADTTFLSEGKYGIMLQYGHWGYPQTGNKKDIDQQATDFDVNAFVNWVKSTGAGYIVWSATWWTYELNTPSPVVDAILNNGGANTSARDLIGDVATAAENAGLDFSTNPPTVISGALTTDEGSASISDADGNLLFYTDGTTVYKRNGQPMINGNNLFGNSSSSQSAIIVPKPLSTNIYYIFTVGNQTGGGVGGNGVFYSEVNMDLDNGFGNIIQFNKNIELGFAVIGCPAAKKPLDNRNSRKQWNSSTGITFIFFFQAA